LEGGKRRLGVACEGFQVGDNRAQQKGGHKYGVLPDYTRKVGSFLGNSISRFKTEMK